MRCIDMNSLVRRSSAVCWSAWGSAALLLGLAGCGSKPPAPTPAPEPARPAAAVAPAPAQPAVPARATAATAKLPPAKVARNWEEFKLQAVRRMVDANPGTTYMGKPQPMLLAVPVLSIELHADGSIKSIEVMRRPSQAPETIQLAIDAVRRAAPFGDMTKLAKPWTFNEVFLFNDDKRFKPRTLDR